MDVEIRHGPAFAVARATPEGGEQIQAESGAMMATSGGVDIQASTQGGVMKGLKRSFLGGESLFISTFTAPPHGGWVDLAHFLTGDIVVLDTFTLAEGEQLTIDTGHVVAYSDTVQFALRRRAPASPTCSRAARASCSTSRVPVGS